MLNSKRHLDVSLVLSREEEDTLKATSAVSVSLIYYVRQVSIDDNTTPLRLSWPAIFSLHTTMQDRQEVPIVVSMCPCIPTSPLEVFLKDAKSNSTLIP